MNRSRPLKICALLAASLSATAAVAQGRPMAPSLSCGSLQRSVERAGAVVISTSRTTFDRFVADGRFCQPTEGTEPAWIVSADRDDCFVGYTCREYSRDDWPR